MPVEGPLPQTGDQHDINADAESCLMARRPRHWRIKNLEGTDDYGFDYQVQITQDQQVSNVFRLQLKGTRSPSISADGEFISVTLKASTVRYYDRVVEPILLVICDLSVDEDPVDCPLHYVWIHEELGRINVSALPAEQKFVTLKAPRKNLLTRKADLSLDVTQQNDFSRVGHLLGGHAEQTHPGLPSEERLSLVQGVTQGITARGASFIEALAAPAQGHWIAPAPGTLAWELSQARNDLLANALERARMRLDTAERMLEGATILEQAEYWCLRGNLHVEAGADRYASVAYQRAYQLSPLPKYQAVWCEAEIRLRFDTARETLPELAAQLQGDDPLIVASRSRLAAIMGDHQTAFQIATLLPEPDRSLVMGFVHWRSGDHDAVVSYCDQGLALTTPVDAVQQVLLLYKARAKFALAHGRLSNSETTFIPVSGLPGVKRPLLEEAWVAITEAVVAFKRAGWKSNIDHIADIWPATALALGKGPQILPLLIEATTARPHLPGIQEALRIVAVECGDIELALRANDSLPPSETKSLWATVLFQQTGKYRLSVQSFQECYERADRLHQWFGTAVVAAILSAQKMVQPGLVQCWLADLQKYPTLHGFAAQARYLLDVERNPSLQGEALGTLRVSYEQLGRPHEVALTLLKALNPLEPEEAPVCVQVAEHITHYTRLGPALAEHVGLALITLKDWSALLELCQGDRVRAEAGDRMLAFEALALDHLGRSDAARDRLEALLASGSTDHVALDTYVTIAVRCGYVSEAIDATERSLEAAGSREQRLECLKLLYSLIQCVEPTSARLRAVVLQIGELVDRTDEVQEAAFLAKLLAATSGEAEDDLQADIDLFQQRASAFFERFPNSHIFRRGEVREGCSPDELVATLKTLTGMTDDREALRRRLEKGLQQGLNHVPFSCRPRFALSSVLDVVHLWEVAKASSRDDVKYHLAMTLTSNRPKPKAEYLRARVPLLDLTTLLVLLDLELIDRVVTFFGTIAVCKATLEELVELSSPVFGSLAYQKCLALQQALKPHFSSILQPSLPTRGRGSGGNSLVGWGNAQITEICQDQATDFVLYSDDAIFRLFCANEGEPDSVCTLDVLEGLVETGLMDVREKAGKIAQLCRWNVRIVVRLPDFRALIPQELLQVANVRQGVEILDGDSDFTTLVSALWDYRLPFQETMQSAAKVLRMMLVFEPLSDIAISAVMAQWFVKAGMGKDAPDQALRTITLLLTHVVNITTSEDLFEARLWRVYLLVVEWKQGYLSDATVEQAIRLLGMECAHLQWAMPGRGEKVFSRLIKALPNGTHELHTFSQAYSTALVQLFPKA